MPRGTRSRERRKWLLRYARELGVDELAERVWEARKRREGRWAWFKRWVRGGLYA